MPVRSASSSLVTYGWGGHPGRGPVGATDVRLSAQLPKDGGYLVPIRTRSAGAGWPSATTDRRPTIEPGGPATTTVQ